MTDFIPTSELKIKCKRSSDHVNLKGTLTVTVTEPDIDDLIKQLTAAQIWNVHQHFPYQLLDLIGEQTCIDYFNIKNNE